jgi:hypothetical protein
MRLWMFFSLTEKVLERYIADTARCNWKPESWGKLPRRIRSAHGRKRPDFCDDDVVNSSRPTLAARAQSPVALGAVHLASKPNEPAHRKAVGWAPVCRPALSARDQAPCFGRSVSGENSATAMSLSTQAYFPRRPDE